MQRYLTETRDDQKPFPKRYKPEHQKTKASDSGKGTKRYIAAF